MKQSSKEVKDFLNLGVVFNKKGEVLLIKRKKKEKGKGGVILEWAFPAGKQHIGESREECVRREVLAETGYEVVPFKQASMRFHPQFPVMIVYHLCRLASEKPVKKPIEKYEVSQIKWVKPKDLKKFITTDLDPNIAKELKITE